MEKSRSLVAVLLLACSAGFGYGQDSHPVTHRQFSDVSGGPDWLARAERETEEQPEKALDALEIAKGSTVADVGCANGYMTVRLARRVGQQGTVYAEDIQPQMLNLMVRNAKAQGLDNIKPILGTDREAKLPKESVDLIILVDVYHEFQHPQEMLRSMHDALKPGGRMVLFEYRAEDPKVMIRELHKMTVAQTRAEIEPEGFHFDKSIETLPMQHLIIFRK
jgi:ubiquinone/menaquinone biosynthesis C-methylase UbiE